MAFSANTGERMKQKTKLDSALDELLAGKTPEEIVGPDGLLKQLTKRLVERAMGSELTHHLGYEKHAAEGRGTGNARNGTSRKRMQGDFGAVEIEVPRDRNGTFRTQADSETRAAVQRLRRQDPVDVCARHDHAGHSGPAGRDLWSGSEPDVDQRVTDPVVEEVTAWQNRPLTRSI
jgi:transposase-like protein